MQAVVHEVDEVLMPEFLGFDSGDGRLVYHFGDGSGTTGVTTNFTLVFPGPNNKNTSDIVDPVYQITDAGLKFSVTPPPSNN